MRQGDYGSEPMPKAPEGYACCRTRSEQGRVQVSHLVRRGPRGGTPGPTLCGLTRFDQRDREGLIVRAADLPGWDIDGGTWGPGVEQVKCPECWAVAAGDEIRYEMAGATANVEWRRDGVMGCTGATSVSMCSKCGALVADEGAHTRWHGRQG